MTRGVPIYLLLSLYFLTPFATSRWQPPYEETQVLLLKTPSSSCTANGLPRWGDPYNDFTKSLTCLFTPSFAACMESRHCPTCQPQGTHAQQLDNVAPSSLTTAAPSGAPAERRQNRQTCTNRVRKSHSRRLARLGSSTGVRLTPPESPRRRELAGSCSRRTHENGC